MAFLTNDVTELFSSAVIDTGNNTITVSGTDLTSINFGTESGVYNVIFGLVDSIAAAVSTGNMQNITVGQSQSLVGGNTLRKNYNFSINLDFNNDIVEGVLDVKSEPAPE
jgi:hypothetical protein